MDDKKNLRHKSPFDRGTDLSNFSLKIISKRINNQKSLKIQMWFNKRKTSYIEGGQRRQWPIDKSTKETTMVYRNYRLSNTYPNKHRL